MNKNIAVIMGGWSAEREVSLSSGATVIKALKEMGESVTVIDVQRDMGSLMTRLLPRPRVVFNALHGRYGEDGSIQGILDILGIPYTHSGVLASALAMNKVMAKSIFKMNGIPTPEFALLTREELSREKSLSKPYVLKPVNEGSSVGVYIIRAEEKFEDPKAMEWPYGEKVLVEKYIEGQELTVSIMGDRALTVTEIEVGEGFYDYNAKYIAGGSRHILPAKISSDVHEEALRLAKLAHDSLGCRGLSRADFRYDGRDLFILEVNTQPGLTSTSLAPEQAAYVGISFKELVSWMIQNATFDS